MAHGSSVDGASVPLTLRVELSSQCPTDEAALRAALPAKPGILVLEDSSARALSVIAAADLRRAAISRLGPAPPDQPRSARSDLRGVARLALACTVGSAFESDWAYFQIARARLPQTFRHMLDRWQAWFIHCDSERPFPQWVKTSQPGQPPTILTGRQGVYVGPFADKHAAHRFIEILEDAFDLCRYHHILVQAPRGSACAYKEMGRCPAPCDGSIAMSQYLEQVHDSIAFARSPDAGRQLWEQRMRSASAAMDFETAQRCKTRLERTAAALKPKFRHVRDLNDFRIVAVLPSEREHWARLMLIDRGRIVPVADVSGEAHQAQLAEIVVACQAIFAAWFPAALGDGAVDNIGMICRHLMQARVRSRVQPRRRRAVFLHLADGLNVAGLRKAMSAVCAETPRDSLEAPSEDAASTDEEIEGHEAQHQST